MNSFSSRHIGPDNTEKTAMLAAIGVQSVQELIDKTIPAHIRLDGELNIDPAMTEQEYLQHITVLGMQNQVFKSFIGLGYNETITPSVILRNVLENPGWYTAYTPYQAEISQGRLEALLNFQTMVLELTGMEIANASLLDEATAAAEAMIMFYNSRSRQEVKDNQNKFFIAESAFPQTIEVVLGRALNLGIELVQGDAATFVNDGTYFGAVIQYPDTKGAITDVKGFISRNEGLRVAVAADILALVILQSPGSLGADVVFGSSQRFGVPMGAGGPHAAFFAAKDEYKRTMPGRIIGVSKDADDNLALRMALQTREQHIKRDKATSNICTAQALLAVMASMYAVYHGPARMKAIAEHVHSLAVKTAKGLKAAGITVASDSFFDTVWVKGVNTASIKAAAEAKQLNFRIINDSELTISFGEPHTTADVATILSVFGANTTVSDEVESTIASTLLRTDAVFTHPTFNRHHSESKMMRYLKRLENKDLSLVHSMIPLGSCTMKLNAASELIPITNPQFANMHPFAPVAQAAGYHAMFRQLEKDLCESTGFAAMSLQPNSGAQGEYAGLMVIKAYHESRGDKQRTKMIIPSSAHGTNPASAVMAGFEVVVTGCDDNGNINIDELREVATALKDELAGLMVTYPSTHGVYEEGIREITTIIHDNGGQVYMDGANMNAQVGLTNPGNIGADVCHLNLHKTFAIPHGGGGPGMGPIGVAAHLAPFLPSNPVVAAGGDQPIHAVSAAPYGSALILLISYGYIKMLGAKGLRESTEMAILNANYIAAKLKGHYDVLYTGKNGTVAHEMILDCREFKKNADVEVADMAKRLIDFGFHAPTVSFPVAGTLMIEPTESEDKEELDRFIEAMIKIRQEIREIENGHADKANNLLKNAPHTADCIINKDWNYPYSPQEAAYPVAYLKEWKYWVPVRRVDNAYGDRNLVCSCPSVESYMHVEA
ncbi:MAG: glycine dehydrogenase (aminomethyl-transferring) [Candidatus Fluviicola riflensis]|nr:MAG: glycine dehydrogenase (aminomethyl-transferring) [Candidatus Fluviicola riflensis]OGS78380.1 MAG: glycine dehydrogenase (aminomethyl-transferring) [Candidatus Fluviicola riflensis]OGS85446.1 MAG: glycine dehydrogenase (aminomethyl-transferring) [Fluviicola sp. RIFCSPHIGHO2_01_FULL_43_53]OGS87488.1 MAG: glycine dehydrogenase (aminomethyl-transferring) [Fluviicola sp. RIFCSPHIGHO2_12_FULL_43_24]